MHDILEYVVRNMETCMSLCLSLFLTMLSPVSDNIMFPVLLFKTEEAVLCRKLRGVVYAAAVITIDSFVRTN